MEPFQTKTKEKKMSDNKEVYKLSNQALGAVMMALQESLLNVIGSIN